MAVTRILSFTTTGTNTWTVPNDWTSPGTITIIGGGGGGGRAANASGSAGGGGGGGFSSSSVSLTPGAVLTYNIGTAGTGATTLTGAAGGNGGDTWIRTDGGTTIPTSNTQGILAKGGTGGPGTGTGVRTGGAGGSAASGFGDIVYSGGDGGAGSSSIGYGGGGGGSAGSSSVLGNGGSGAAGVSTVDGGGGGGGGVRGNGNVGTTTTGGAGGLNYNGSAGGAGGIINNAGSPGSNGGGGGGGGGSNTGGVPASAGGAGGSGSEYSITSGGTSGAGGGGGGGGGTNNSSTAGGAGAAGGLYGAGGGGGGSGGSSAQGGAGGNGTRGVMFISYTINAPSTAYWVGGTGFWSDVNSNNWASTSGGTGGAGVPDNTSNAVFDNNSDTGANLVVTYVGTQSCVDLTFTSLGRLLSFEGSTAFNLLGSLELPSANLSFANYSGTFTFAATTSRTIKSNGFVIPFTATFNGISGTWTLLDAFNTSGNAVLTNGTLALSSFSLTCLTFSSNNSNSRSITGTGSIITTSVTSGVTVWNTSTVTNLTTSGTVVANISGTGSSTSTITVTPGALSEANAISFIFSSTATGGAGRSITVTGGSTFKNITIPNTQKTLNFNAGSSTYTVYGNIDIQGNTPAISGSVNTTISFAATSGTQTVTMNGGSLDHLITKVGAGNLQLVDNFTNTRSFTLTTGNLDLNNKSLSCTFFSSTNTNIRSVNFGSTGVIVTTSATTITHWDTGTVTNFTASGTSNVVIAGTNSSGSIISTITAGAMPEDSAISFYVTANSTSTGTRTISISGAIKDLTLTNATKILSNNTLTMYGNLNIGGSSVTITAGANVLTFGSTSSTQTITTNGRILDFPITKTGAGTLQLLDATTLGVTRTFTLTQGTLNVDTYVLSTGIFSSTNTNTRNITFNTGGAIVTLLATAANVWDTTTVTNLSITGTSNVTISGTASGSITSTIIAGTPTESNTINFICSGSTSTGTRTIAFTSGNNVKDVVIVNTAKTITLGGLNIYGNLDIQGSTPNLTTSGSSVTFSATSGTQLITSNTKILPFPVVKSGSGILRLVDALNINQTFTLTSGTFDANSANVTANSFSSTNSNIRTLTLGSGTWTLRSTGTIWDVSTSTNLTLNANTSNIVLSDTSTIARTFAGGGLTYYKLNIGGTTGSSTTTITGNNTFNELATTKTVTHTLKFTSGTTTTVTTWSISGTNTSVLATISATTPGSQYTLAKTGGGGVRANYLNISDAYGSTTNTWYMGVNSTDGGNNTNILFTPFPRYWIGGSGTWNNTNTSNWAFTSGGSADGLYPDNNSNVFFDAGSDSSAPFTVTIGAAVQCYDITMSGLDQVMTFTGTESLSIYGNMTFTTTNVTYSYTGDIGILGNDLYTRYITTGGASLLNTIDVFLDTPTYFNYVIFNDTLTTTKTIYIDRGYVKVGQNITCQAFIVTSTYLGEWNIDLRNPNPINLYITGNNSTVFSIPDSGLSGNYVVPTYTNPGNVYLTYSGSTGTRVLVNPYVAGLNIYVNNGTDQVNITGRVFSLNFTGFSGTWVNNTLNINGSTVVSTGMTVGAGANTVNLAPLADSGTPTGTITTNGKTLDFNITKSGITSIVNMLDDFTMGSTRTLTLSSGTLNANSYAVSIGRFSSSGTSTRTLTLGNGTWTLSGTGTVWTINSTNLTFNKGTSNILLSDTSTTSRTFAGGGLTYNKLTIGGTTGTSTTTITGDNTFSELASTKTVAHTLQFGAGSTNTVTTWTINGSSGNVVTLTTDNTGAPTPTFTLVNAPAITISVSYLNISYSIGSPSGKWRALLSNNNINSGNNTGWVFALTNTTNFFSFFVRN